jgi:uncharacterized protein (TIGR03437 family)
MSSLRFSTTQTLGNGDQYSDAGALTTNNSAGGVAANVTFAGIVEAGLFQINIVVPNVPTGDQAITASIGGATTTRNVFLTIQ